MRDWLVPPDFDRTKPLESRSDLLGRTLRLLVSVHHPALKDSVGSMLFAMFDSDRNVIVYDLWTTLTSPLTAVLLSTHVGYGNVAGFLFRRGMLNALPSSSMAPLVTPSGDVINPITGVVQDAHADVEMTEEEKEKEAEKLFTLFETLEKKGIIPADQNPIRKCAQWSAVDLLFSRCPRCLLVIWSVGSDLISSLCTPQSMWRVWSVGME
jgi:hypothetical protein